MAEEFLVVGQVVAAQGLKGEVRILPASDFPQRFTEPGTRWLRRRGQNEQEVQLLSGRQLPGKELFVVRFEGINDRTAAEGLVHQELLVAADDLPELEEGEFHLLDLQGLNVRLENEAEPIGVVVDLHHGGNDLLEIELKEAAAAASCPSSRPSFPRWNWSKAGCCSLPPKGCWMAEPEAHSTVTLLAKLRG